MHSEFISLNSRIIIKGGLITEKRVKTDTEEVFTRLIAFVALLGFLAYCIYRIVADKDYFFILQLLLVVIWLIPHFKRIYTFLFVKTWKSSLRIDDIQFVASSILENGLETQVVLQLKNGRKKIFIFRNAENQVECFINSIETKELVQAVE